MTGAVLVAELAVGLDLDLDLPAHVFASLLPAGDVHPPPVEVEVQRLVRAARLGSAPAAGRLYDALIARVYRAVRPLCDSDADAEDATQDAFVDAFTHLERYEARPGIRFVAWVVTVALNRARRTRDRARRAEPRAPAELLGLGEAAARPEPDPSERLALRVALLEALARFPARDREVLALYHGAELTAAEVGRAVGTSAANVRKICERRRRELQLTLEESREAK